jgi:hypothetical protein
MTVRFHVASMTRTQKAKHHFIITDNEMKKTANFEIALKIKENDNDLSKRTEEITETISVLAVSKLNGNTYTCHTINGTNNKNTCRTTKSGSVRRIEIMIVVSNMELRPPIAFPKLVQESEIKNANSFDETLTIKMVDDYRLVTTSKGDFPM